MCLNPLTVGSDEWGEPIIRNCRKCWQCIGRKVDDWVGRCVAETRTSRAVRFVTLTYGRDEAGNASHPAMAFLTYSHVQQWISLLRSAGYEFSYFIAGEYGTEKGRAHWHAILFFRNEPPDVVLNKRIDHKLPNGWEIWPHGFSQWEKLHGDAYRAVRYAAKYVQKGEDDFSSTHIAMSKKPPLGARYFQEEARRLVDQGLPLRFEYTFPDVLRRKGHRVKLRVSGKCKQLMLEAYEEHWRKTRTEPHPPHSEEADDLADKLAHVPAGDKLDWIDKPRLEDLPPTVVIDWNAPSGWDKNLRKYRITDQHGRTWWWFWLPVRDKEKNPHLKGTGKWRNLRKVRGRLGDDNWRLVPYRDDP